MEFDADNIRPSRYANDHMGSPLTIRLPATLQRELDLFVANAKDNGYGFVSRSYVIREALEAYLEPLAS